MLGKTQMQNSFFSITVYCMFCNWSLIFFMTQWLYFNFAFSFQAVSVFLFPLCLDLLDTEYQRKLIDNSITTCDVCICTIGIGVSGSCCWKISIVVHCILGTNTDSVLIYSWSFCVYVLSHFCDASLVCQNATVLLGILKGCGSQEFTFSLFMDLI